MRQFGMRSLESRCARPGAGGAVWPVASRQSAFRAPRSRGFFLIAAVVMLMVIAVVTAAFLLVVLAHTRVLGDEHRRTVALNLAEAGIEIGLARMEQRSNYRGERGVQFDGGTLDIEVTRSGRRFVINARGRVQGPNREITRRVRLAGRRLPTRAFVFDTWQEFGR